MLGPIHHVGYLALDLEAAIREFTETFGHPAFEVDDIGAAAFAMRQVGIRFSGPDLRGEFQEPIDLGHIRHLWTLPETSCGQSIQILQRTSTAVRARPDRPHFAVLEFEHGARAYPPREPGGLCSTGTRAPPPPGRHREGVRRGVAKATEIVDCLSVG